MNRSNAASHYEPLVQMAREMAVDSGVPAQLQFDALLDLLHGPSHLRRIGWYLERNRGLVILIIAIATTTAALLAI